MLKEIIGFDAGLIWQLLSEKGTLTIDELAKLTGYRETYIHLALGWLSRENRISYFEKDDTLCIELSK